MYYYLRKLAEGFFALPFPYCNGRGLRFFLIVILLLFVTVAGAGAASEIDTIRFTEAEKNWLAAHPVISIAPDPYFPPIEYFDEEGEYRGVAADYIALVEKRLGIRFEIRRYKSWNEVLEKIRKREVDTLPAAAQTPERSGYVLFSDPHIALPGVIITRKRVEADLTLESLKGMKVSVVKSYAWHEFIRNDYPDIGLDLVPDLETGLKKVSLGVSDALIATLPVAIYYIEKEGITNLRVAGETGYFTRLSFATRSDWPEFHGIIEKTLAQLTEGEKKAVREKWVHLDKDSILGRKFGISAIAGLGAITLIFMGILLWNRTLRKRIEERTRELNRELAEHRKTEGNLRESEKKYRDLVENMKDIFYVADETGRISYISPAAESITGYETSEIIGRSIPDFLHSEDIPMVAEQFQKIIFGITEPNEYRLITKPGNVIWVLTMTQPVYDKDRVVGVQGIITDITDLKRTEEELRKSEEKYRTIIESIQESYFEVDLSGKLTFFNDFLCLSLEYSRDEIMGMDFRDYTTPESGENLYKTFHDVYLTRKPSEIVDYEIITKNGRIGYAELSASLIVDSDGAPVGFRGVARDVTERKRAEREIRERGAYLEEVLRVAPDAVLTLDNDNIIVEWNEGAEGLFGYSFDEAFGQNIDELLTDSDTLHEADAKSRQVLSGKRVPPVEVVRYGKDGKPVNVIVAGSPIMMGGEMIGAVAIYTNITERKRMEELWRRYEFIVNTSGDMMTLINRDYVYEVSNDAYGLGFNLTGQAIAGKTVADVWGKYLFDEVIKDNLDRCFAGEEVNYRKWFEFEALGMRYFDVAYYPYHDENGKVTHAVVVSRDTSEQKRSEDSLLESESRFRSIVENSHEGILIVNNEHKFVYVNEELCRLMGYSSEEMLGRDFRELLPEESRDLVNDRYLRRQIGESMPARYEFNLMRKDGTKRRVEISSAVVTDLKGNVQSIAQLLDITDRKNAEEQLRESEKRYRNILESIEEGYFEVDLVGRFTFFNDALCRVADLPRDELLGLSNLEYTTPNVAEKMYEDFNRIYRTGEPGELLEYEIIRMDGSKRILELSATLRITDEGKPSGFRGVARDVTDRKAAEEKIRKSEEKYRTILENIQEGYFELDLAGNTTFFNESTCRILGYSPDDMMGLNNRNYTTPETAEKAYKIFNEIYRTGNPGEIEDYETIRKDGSLRILEVSAALMRDTNLVPIGFRGVMRDVTDRKRAEEQIRQSLKEKEIMLQEIHHRVKNNMQVVSSMLSLQARAIKDEKMRALFEDSRSRVRSMALIHEKLYLSEDISRIECTGYIRSLVNYLSQVYWVDPNIIRISDDVDEIFFGIETATPFGLLLNELVSNSLKYAFPEGRKGDITIGLHSIEGDKYVLTVSDNGVGMPEDLDFRETKTLGLQLVNALIMQLDATVELDRTGGTSFRIVFEELKYKKRM